MVAERIGDELSDQNVRIDEVSGRFVAHAADECVGDREVAPDVVNAALVDEKRGTCSDRTYGLKDCVRLGDAPHQPESGDAGGIVRARDVTAREKRFDRRGRAERLAVIGDIERLDAVWVAGYKHSPKSRIPYGESEHAAQ